MVGSIDGDSRRESWSPVVDVNRLKQMARGELKREEERAMYRLIRMFDPWEEAFTDALVEEYRAWIARMTRWERFRYHSGNYLMAVRGFFILRVWDWFPSLDPDNRPNPVDEWIRREIEQGLSEADGVKPPR